MRVGINGVGTKRVKFSLPTSNGEMIFDEEYHDARDNDEVKDLGGLEQGEQYPSLQIVESHDSVLKNIKQLILRIFGLLIRGSQKIG